MMKGDPTAPLTQVITPVISSNSSYCSLVVGLEPFGPKIYNKNWSRIKEKAVLLRPEINAPKVLDGSPIYPLSINIF